MSVFVIDIVRGIFGEPKQHHESKSEITFDCPVCSDLKNMPEGDGKGNLAINYETGIYRCWACMDTHNTRGRVHRLVKRYGNHEDLKAFELANPYDYRVKKQEEVVHEHVIALPAEFKPLSEYNNTFEYYQALNYLKGRGIGMGIIKRFNIGYADSGKYSQRIIIPSYNLEGEINYFVCRSYLKYTKLKYLNPEADKKIITINEDKINWDSTVYLVEGMFDHIVVPNSIPMLGKQLNPCTLELILEKASGNVVVLLDPDAWASAQNIYRTLKTFLGIRLTNRVKLIKLDEKYGDISDVYQKYGARGVAKLINISQVSITNFSLGLSSGWV